MTTATMIPGETELKEIVSSARAVKHLAAAGYATLDDVRAQGMEKVHQLPFIGRVSVGELQAAIGPQPEKALAAAQAEATDPKESEIEEGPQPVVLERTPSGPTYVSWAPSNRVGTPGGGYRIQAQIWIVFDQDGMAKVTQRMFWTRLHNRDDAKIVASIEAGEPWRQRCVDMIRRDYRNCGVGFIILSD